MTTLWLTKNEDLLSDVMKNAYGVLGAPPRSKIIPHTLPNDLCIFVLIEMYSLDKDYVEAEVGDSPTVSFTVSSDPPLPENVKHTLSKVATRRFKVEGNVIKFNKVRLTDSGLYTISCRSSTGRLIEETLELEIRLPSNVQPPEYVIDNPFIEAMAGESPEVPFTVVSLNNTNIKHTLTKDRKIVTKRFKIKDNVIVFKKVRVSDTGNYNISCRTEDDVLLEENLQLCVKLGREDPPNSTSTAAKTPKYSLENDYVEAREGESPVVSFSLLSSDTAVADSVTHNLSRNGEAITTKRFKIERNGVTFRKVRVSDSGAYTISCRSKDELIAEETLELSISQAESNTKPSDKSKFFS